MCCNADSNETATSKLAGPRYSAPCLRPSHRVAMRSLAELIEPFRGERLVCCGGLRTTDTRRKIVAASRSHPVHLEPVSCHNRSTPAHVEWHRQIPSLAARSSERSSPCL